MDNAHEGYRASWVNCRSGMIGSWIKQLLIGDVSSACMSIKGVWVRLGTTVSTQKHMVIYRSAECLFDMKVVHLQALSLHCELQTSDNSVSSALFIWCTAPILLLSPMLSCHVCVGIAGSSMLARDVVNNKLNI